MQLLKNSELVRLLCPRITNGQLSWRTMNILWIRGFQFVKRKTLDIQDVTTSLLAALEKVCWRGRASFSAHILLAGKKILPLRLIAGYVLINSSKGTHSHPHICMNSAQPIRMALQLCRFIYLSRNLVLNLPKLVPRINLYSKVARLGPCTVDILGFSEARVEIPCLLVSNPSPFCPY